MAPRQRNADALARMKYLYEASEFMIKLHMQKYRTVKPTEQQAEEIANAGSEPQSSMKEIVQNSEFLQLSRSYTETMKEISKKAVLRMDITTKRSLCKKCSAHLVHGVTARIRPEKWKNLKWLKFTCYNCDHIRRLPMFPKGPKKDRSKEVKVEKSSKRPQKKKKNNQKDTGADIVCE